MKSSLQLSQMPGLSKRVVPAPAAIFTALTAMTGIAFSRWVGDQLTPRVQVPRRLEVSTSRPRLDFLAVNSVPA